MRTTPLKEPISRCNTPTPRSNTPLMPLVDKGIEKCQVIAMVVFCVKNSKHTSIYADQGANSQVSESWVSITFKGKTFKIHNGVFNETFQVFCDSKESLFLKRVLEESAFSPACCRQINSLNYAFLPIDAHH